MALLHLPRTLQGNGGGRIPMDGFSYVVSRHELAAILDAMPTDACRSLHLAARDGDTATAARLMREATASYYANTPAPTAAVAPLHRARHTRHTPRS